ncbi:Kirola-like protein [Drosera capensis]
MRESRQRHVGARLLVLCFLVVLVLLSADRFNSGAGAGHVKGRWRSPPMMKTGIHDSSSLKWSSAPKPVSRDDTSLYGEDKRKQSLIIFPTYPPPHIQGVDVHDGEFGSPGSVIFWNYTIDGKAYVAKEILEAIDVENKPVTYSVIEGDVAEEYKTFKLSIHIVPKGEVDVVKWTFEYEKMHEVVNLSRYWSWLSMSPKTSRHITFKQSSSSFHSLN